MWRALYLWLCDRLYNELAGLYDAVSFLISFGQWDAWRGLAATQVQGSRVLELGCGTGALLARLGDSGRTVVGLDASPAMIARAARRAGTRGGHIHLVQARGEALPFIDAGFDAIVSTFPAPYILEPATLDECRRVLAAGRRPNHEPPGMADRRLIIVGLWVRPGAGALRAAIARWMPVFFATTVDKTARLIEARCAAAGLRATVEEAAWNGFFVGQCIARPVGIDVRPAQPEAGEDRRLLGA